MNTIASSYKISQGFCVNEYELKDTEVKDTVKVREPINHVFCCDISGSMWRSLPKMREQLKNRLSSIVEENDTISIIVFADPEDCAVVKEHVHCNNARELSELHKAIDRFLVDRGCTDFYTPLELTRKLIRPKERYNFVFLSDGYHNCCSYDKVIGSLNKLAPEIAQCTVIEYGYNADSDRLSQMAEILGGSKIPSADFDEYVPVMENVFKGGAVAPKVKVFVTASTKNMIKPIVIFLNEGTSQVTSVVVEDDGYALLPTSVKKFWTVTRTNAAPVNQKPLDLDGFYGVAYVLADKLEYDLVEDLLYYIGDKKFINQYQSSFGKQKLFVFQNDLAAAVFDKSQRGEIDPNFKASDDRYCVIDFFNELSTNTDNLVRVASEDFNYNRIGAKSVDKVVLNDDEQKALAEAKSAAAAQAILDKAKKRQVKMTKIDKGYPLDSFVWNEDRANLGGLFNIDVELELPENQFGLTLADRKSVV